MFALKFTKLIGAFIIFVNKSASLHLIQCWLAVGLQTGLQNMAHETGIYIGLLIGFGLLLIFIRFLPAQQHPMENLILMYYKIDLTQRKVSLISSRDLEIECISLNNNEVELICLKDLEAFTEQRIQLKANSYFIAINESYGLTLKNALPVLIKENISMIIFLPIYISSNTSNYQHQSVQQLNDFIFSEEFKNIFSYEPTNSRPVITK